MEVDSHGVSILALRISDMEILTRSRNGRTTDYFVIYNGKYSRGESVAIEPMTSAPDTFNNGIGVITLKKGTSSIALKRFLAIQRSNGRSHSERVEVKGIPF